MSSRKSSYVIGVILAAVLFSVPHLLMSLNVVLQLFAKPIWPLPSILTTAGPSEFFDHRGQLQKLQFWRDKFLHSADIKNESGEIVARKIILVDPDSGEVEKIESKYPGEATFETCICGDELWFTRVVQKGDNKQALWVNETYELVDQVFQESNRQSLFGYGNEPSNVHQFLWEGKLAFVSQPSAFLADNSKRSNAIVISTRQNDAWQPVGQLSIPEVTGEWIWEGKPIRLTPESVEFDKNNARPGVQIYNSGDTTHLFVHTGRRDEGRLFYHEGLKVTLLPAAVHENEPVDQAIEVDETALALLDKETDENTEHWSLVREKPTIDYLGFGQTNGLLIDGKPVALIIDNILEKDPGGMTGRLYPTAQLYRLEGTTWNEYASMPLPIGSMTFATFTTRDGQRSYLVSRSYLGESYVYALEANGFRETSGSASLKARGYEWKNPVYEDYEKGLRAYGVILIIILVLGIVQAACTSLLMRRFTSSDYGFGMQTVRLASLGWRGTARLIDLVLVVVPNVALLGWLTRGFDWVSNAEAQVLWVEHSSKQSATQIMVILLVSIFAISFATVIAQAKWGITLGKWLCGLRTVRTTLRPCGFAQSIAREILFVVDCCNFIYWAPGILSIAFTDLRQRLGDLVADTIVVESRSLIGNSNAESICPPVRHTLKMHLMFWSRKSEQSVRQPSAQSALID